MKNETDIEIMKEILRIRLTQVIINEKHKQNEFKIPIHLALGHEAIAVAIDKIMKEDDNLFLTHRNIHYNLARNKSLKKILDEYLLKKTGLGGGYLGSMNLSNEEKGIPYTSSILGNNLSVATGFALAKKVKSEKGIVIVQTGDGAMEEGSFYENLVLLKSNNLPCLIIIENNDCSLATKIKERRCDIDIKKLTESIGAEYRLLDSNDVYEYIQKLNEIKLEALTKKIPICVEVKLTTLGHWYIYNDEHPQGKYVNYHAGLSPSIDLKKDIIIEQSETDPVFVLTKHFKKERIDSTLQEIKKNIEKEINVI